MDNQKTTTIEVDSCASCPFLGGRSMDHDCTHEDGPDEDAVSSALSLTTYREPTIAKGCPLVNGPTLVQLRV